MAAMFVLTTSDADGFPSVEVCTSVKECIDSVRFQMKGAGEDRIRKMEEGLTAHRAWTDEDGTTYTIRQRGGR